MSSVICIVCPKGCHMEVGQGPEHTITGNSCPRGAEYGRKEVTHPTRVITSTVRCTGGAHPRCPVKTSGPIPKELIPQAMACLNGVELTAPVHIGEVVVSDLLGTGVDFVATREI